MWSRLRLDIGWSDLAAASVGRGARPAIEHDDAIACLSVRTAFDLLLSALALPPGSEVLMSAVTIPHMPAIVREHGLVPVPLDIDPATMAPRPGAFECAVTDKTRVLVVAHLLGGRVPLEHVGALAGEHGLLVVEDCAQAFDGSGCPIDDRADIALYSFGTIKTATALGGAVARVRDPDLLATMRALHDAYPCQPNGEHRRKVAKSGVLKLASTRPAYGPFVKVVGRDGHLDERLHAAIAGFRDDQLLERIRRQPSPSLRSLLSRRLAGPDTQRIERRSRLGDRLAVGLPEPFEMAGGACSRSTHWVAPLLAPRPEEAVAELRRAGFDATRWSSMIAVPCPPGHGCGPPSGAATFLEHAVFVPCYADMSDRGHRRLLETLATIAAGQRR